MLYSYIFLCYATGNSNDCLMLAYTIELEQNKNQFSKNLDEKIKKNTSIIYQLFHIINIYET